MVRYQHMHSAIHMKLTSFLGEVGKWHQAANFASRKIRAESDWGLEPAKRWLEDDRTIEYKQPHSTLRT